VKTLTRALVSVALAAGGIGSLPSVAHAVDPVTVSITSNGSTIVASPSTVTASQLSISWDPSSGTTFGAGVVSNELSLGGVACTSGPLVCVVPFIGSLVLDVNPASDPDEVVNLTAGNGFVMGSLLLTYGIPPSPEPTPSSDGVSGPSAYVQQFGKPAAGTCDAAAPADLNWSGVASGGWAVSWSQWMNGGTGGTVCTRTLVYGPRGVWVVE